MKSVYSEHSDRFLTLFPANNYDEAHESQIKFSVLTSFGIQSYKWMLLQNNLGESNVFMYNFKRDVPFGIEQSNYGAFHS